MKSKTPDEAIFVHICSTKLYITIWKQYSWVWLSNSQKTTVARYQTCYTNSTVGSIYWRTSSLLQYSQKIAARHYACYTSNTNNKLAFFQNVLVFFDGKQSFEPCPIILFSNLLFRLINDTNSSYVHGRQYVPHQLHTIGSGWGGGVIESKGWLIEEKALF